MPDQPGTTPDVRFGQAEGCVRAGDTQVRRRRKLQPAAQRQALDGGDQGRAQPRHAVEDGVAVPHPVAPDVEGIGAGPGFDVGADAERPLAGRAQDDDADAVVALDAVRGIAQSGQHRRRQRVEFFGPVQRDAGERAVAREGDAPLAHAARSLSASPMGSGPEQACRHLPEVVGDRERERRLPQHVAFQVDAGRDLDHLRPAVCQAQHAALGDVEDVLPLRPCAPAAEGHVLDPLDQLPHLPFALDPERAALDGERRSRR